MLRRSVSFRLEGADEPTHPGSAGDSSASSASAKEPAAAPRASFTTSDERFASSIASALAPLVNRDGSPSDNERAVERAYTSSRATSPAGSASSSSSGFTSFTTASPSGTSPAARRARPQLGEEETSLLNVALHPLGTPSRRPRRRRLAEEEDDVGRLRRAAIVSECCRVRWRPVDLGVVSDALDAVRAAAQQPGTRYKDAVVQLADALHVPADIARADIGAAAEEVVRYGLAVVDVLDHVHARERLLLAIVNAPPEGALDQAERLFTELDQADRSVAHAIREWKAFHVGRPAVTFWYSPDSRERARDYLEKMHTDGPMLEALEAVHEWRMQRLELAWLERLC